MDEAARELGRLDILINMASVYKPVPLDDTSAALWDAVVDVDLRAAFLCAHAAFPTCAASSGGRIINFTDWVAVSGRPRYKGFLPYYVAKRGVIGLTEALALELAPDQILVNAVAPGPILAPEAPATRNRRRSKPPRRSAAGAGRSRSSRRWRCSSTAISSPARPSASMADGTSADDEGPD